MDQADQDLHFFSSLDESILIIKFELCTRGVQYVMKTA